MKLYVPHVAREGGAVLVRGAGRQRLLSAFMLTALVGALMVPLVWTTSAFSEEDDSTPGVVAPTPLVIEAGADREVGTFEVEGFDSTDILLVSVALLEGSLASAKLKFLGGAPGGLTAGFGYNLSQEFTRISFTGTMASVNSALEKLRLSSTAGSVGSAQISVSETLNTPGYFFFPTNGHFYKPMTWPTGDDYRGGMTAYENILELAEAETFKGQNGYLVTITSAEEQDFISKNTNQNNILIALSQRGAVAGNNASTLGQWTWDAGPEKDTLIYSGFNGTGSTVSGLSTTGGAAVNGAYSAWCGSEPNNWGTGEWIAVTKWGGGGCWNDYGPPASTFPGSITGYVIEFGSGGGPAAQTWTDFFEGNVSHTIGEALSAPVITSITPGNAALAVNFSAPVKDGGSPIENYEYSVNGGEWVALNPVSTVSPLQVTNLTNGETYNIRIRARNADGLGAISSTLSSSPVDAPPPPEPDPVPETGSASTPKPKPPVVDPFLTQNTTTNGTSQVLPPGRTPAPSNPPALLSGPLGGVNGGNSLPPSAPTALIGGRQVPVNSQVLGGNQLNMQTGNTTFGVGVSQGQGSVSSGPGGSSELRVPAGGSTQLSGSGLFPGSTVQVFMPFGQNGSREVSQLTVDSTGSFSGDAVFATRPTDPPLPIGRNVLQIASLNDAGERVVVEMAINIAQPPPAPQALRDDGTIPALTPGQSLATQAGVPIGVSLTVNSNTGNALVEGDGWALSMTLGDGNDVSETADGGAVLTMVRGAEASVSGSGFMPLTRADIWLFSDPTLLGSVEIDENGEFNGVVSIDGRVVPVGDHTLQLQGVGVDGFILAANMGVVVTDADDQAAPATSEASVSMLWWVIAVLVLIAILAVVWWRIGARRREV